MSNVSSIVVVVPAPSVKVSTVGGPQGQQGVPGQSAIQRVAASAMSAGQVVRTHAAGQQMQAATTDLRTRPFDAILLGDIGSGATGNFHVAGPVPANVLQLGAGVACAVGVNASGVPVRATDPTCVSAPNWLGTCDDLGNVTINPLRRDSFDPIDFGALPDDATLAASNSVAVAAMFAAMPGGSTAIFQPGTWYLSDNVIPVTPVIVRGVSRNNTFLNFPVAGKGLRLWGSWMTGGTGALYSHATDMHIQCTKLTIAEWQPSHSYNVGDRVRSKLLPLATSGASPSFGSPYQHDHGFHMRCTQAGMSGSYPNPNGQPLWSSVPENAGNPGDEQTIDGGCIWVTEDWSGISVSANLVHVERCIITNPTDNGIAVFGFAVRTLADVSVIKGNLCLSGDGNGIHNTGYDANASEFSANTCNGFERGAILHDDGALGNYHAMNNGATCRVSYFSSGATPNHVWISNYFENDCGPVCFQDGGPSIWISGQGSNFSPETTCTRFDGDRWVGGLLLRTTNGQMTIGLGQANNRQRLIGPVNPAGGLAEPYAADDPNDPDTGGLWTQTTLGGTGANVEDTLDEGSLYGPFRKRFPVGFFLGSNYPGSGKSQQRVASSNGAPTSADLQFTGTLLWRKGDVVLNADAGSLAVAPGWVAARNGGWGGGYLNAARPWSSSKANVCVGDGIEPSVPNTFVYRLLRYEVFSGVQWIRDNAITGALSVIGAVEPTWPLTPGLTVNSTIDGTHRVVWECWGNVGMTWSEMPAPTTQVTT